MLSPLLILKKNNLFHMNHLSECYKKLVSRLWPVLFTLTYFFLTHTLFSSEVIHGSATFKLRKVYQRLRKSHQLVNLMFLIFHFLQSSVPDNKCGSCYFSHASTILGTLPPFCWEKRGMSLKGELGKIAIFKGLLVRKRG